jgi:hypothetical protein
MLGQVQAVASKMISLTRKVKRWTQYPRVVGVTRLRMISASLVRMIFKLS